MPPFPKPAFRYDYEVSDEVEALRGYRDTRPGHAIPYTTTHGGKEEL